MIVPLIKINSYKRDDTLTYFFPVLGFFKPMKKDFQEKHDLLVGTKEFSREHPGKKLFVSNIGGSVLIMLRDAHYIKEFLQKQQSYNKSEFVNAFLPLLGTGLLLAEGDTWKRHRKVISNSFHYEFIKDNIPLVQNTTKEFLDGLSKSDYNNYSAISKVQEITGEIVGRIFFGENLNNYRFEGKPLTIALADLVTELANHARTLPALFFGRKILNLPIFPGYAKTIKRVKDFRAICNQIIQDRKAQPKQINDMLAFLIASQKLDDVFQRFSDEDIINEFVTFFTAGMDTTAHLVAMALYCLDRNPQYLEDLKKERDATYNTEERVSAENLQKMNVLHSVLKEALRFYTPAPYTFPRVAVEDHKLGDLSVKKGSLVRPDFMTMFFDDKYFDNPTQFSSYRWIDNQNKKLDPYTFIPFSAGPRNCIGQHLAIIEAKVIVSEFLNRFTFKIDESYQLKMRMGFSYEAAEEIRLHLTPIN